jgi:hypothetical protein
MEFFKSLFIGIGVSLGMWYLIIKSILWLIK